MIDLIAHGILQSQLSLWIAAGLAGAGIAVGFFLDSPRAWLFGLAGKAALGAALFLAGYQAADDRAAQQARIAALEANNARLARDIALQKKVAQNAALERDGVLEKLKGRDAKVADYESRLANQKPQQICNLDAADVRAVHGVRAKSRR